MNILDRYNFVLDAYEGPLAFLYQLICRQEIEICEISLKELIYQFLTVKQEKNANFDEENMILNEGAEFLSYASTLLWLKSKMLLPKEIAIESESLVDIDADDPNFAIIHHLVEYCRFKEAAKKLSVIEEKQSSCHLRGLEGPHIPAKPLGIDHITFEELASLFQDAIKKSKQDTGRIQDEVWRVSDKIKFLRQELNRTDKIRFFDLFTPNKTRDELVVTFLAILELMKLGMIAVERDIDSNEVVITAVSVNSKS